MRRTLTLAAVVLLGLASSAGVGSYTVSPGDTLGGIARRLGVSVDSLAKTNAIANPDLVIAGDVLKVPGAAAAAPATTYTVRSGDTLAAIADRMGVTTAALAEANAIRNPNVILIGQVLHKPGAAAAAPAPARAAAPPAPARTYVVVRGDTLSLVALHLGVDIGTLASANRITDRNVVYLGQILTVPGGAAPAAPAKAKAPASTGGIVFDPIASVKYVAPGAAPTVVVKAGDTASKIASRAHVSVAALRAANPGRSLDVLAAGSSVKLPGPPVLLCPVAGTVSFVDTWGAAREGTSRHEGVDMFAARGTPAVASVGGTLEFRHGAVGGNAYYLHGDDGNTYYGAHLDAIIAKAGRIEAGQQIGVVGDTGDAKGTPTHLHFEVHPGGGNPVDPYFTADRWC
jgi:LysM repeat protein